MEIKAIFFDLDGTLVDKKTNTIPLSTQDALHTLREKNIKLFIASGRPPIWAEEVKEQVDFAFDGKVLLNGQYCVDENDIPFYTKPLSIQQIQGVLDWMNKHADVSLNFMEADYVYTNGEGDKYVLKDDPARALVYDIYQISPQVGPEFDEELLRQVPGVKSARWNDSSTDLIPGDGGKTVGIQQILDRYGLKKEQCMAFGDGANDIEMLQYVGIGVAMGNGDDHVKKAADYVTDKVDEDGIKNALVHYGLIKREDD